MLSVRAEVYAHVYVCVHVRVWVCVGVGVLVRYCMPVMR